MELGRALAALRQDQDDMRLRLHDRAEHHADLLVAADGYHSTTRRLLREDAADAGCSYAGYMLWRGVIDDASVPRSL